MQPTPRVTTIVTAIAIVLALIGIGGVAFGAADKPSDNEVASTDSTTTTSEFSTDSTLPGDTTTTTPAGSVTTSGNKTATTKAPGTATTAGGSKAITGCNDAPATAADPGQAKPPAVGKYTFVSCTDSDDSVETSITAGNSSGGVTRRVINANEAGMQQSSTIAYGPNGVFIESLSFDTPQGRATCDLNPDVKNYPADIHVGSEWSTSSTCDIKTANGTKFGTIKLDSAGKITGKVATTVGGAAVNGWVAEGVIDLTATIPSFGSQTSHIVERGYYDAAHGIEVFRHTEATSGSSKVVRDDKLVSLTPK